MMLRSSCVSLLIAAMFLLMVCADAVLVICIWLSDSVIAPMDLSSIGLFAP